MRSNNTNWRHQFVLKRKLNTLEAGCRDVKEFRHCGKCRKFGQVSHAGNAGATDAHGSHRYGRLDYLRLLHFQIPDHRTLLLLFLLLLLLNHQVGTKECLFAIVSNSFRPVRLPRSHQRVSL